MVSASKLRLLMSSASTNTTALAASIPTATKPAAVAGSSGVIDFTNGDTGTGQTLKVPSYVQFFPFGTNANNEDFAMRVTAWYPYLASGGTIWIPRLLLQLGVTLGNIDATAFGPALSFMADTITVTSGPPEGPYRCLISPASASLNELGAGIKVHTLGASLLKVEFDIDSGPAPNAAAGANTLWHPVD